MPFGGFGRLTTGRLRTPNFARGEIWWRRRESNRRQVFKNTIISNI
jgi:hypothetical protein